MNSPTISLAAQCSQPNMSQHDNSNKNKLCIEWECEREVITKQSLKFWWVVLMKVTIVLDGGKKMTFHRWREQASSKKQEAAQQHSAWSVECGAWSWRLELVLVRVLMYCVLCSHGMVYVVCPSMRRYHVPCRPHIVRRSTYVGPTDRPTDQLKNWPRSTTLFSRQCMHKRA